MASHGSTSIVDKFHEQRSDDLLGLTRCEAGSVNPERCPHKTEGRYSVVRTRDRIVSTPKSAFCCLGARFVPARVALEVLGQSLLALDT
jgi:hypothetical protein